MSGIHSMGFMVMEDEECLTCKRAVNSLNTGNEFFCRVCKDIHGKVCRKCRSQENLICPQCGMPLRPAEDAVQNLRNSGTPVME